MGQGRGFYQALEVLHILAVVVGFGPLMWNGLVAARAKRRPAGEMAAVSEVNFEVSGVALYAVYLVFVLGVALVLASKKAFKFSESWIGASMGLYIVLLGIAHGVLVRGHRRYNVLARELATTPTGAGRPPQVDEMAGIERRLAVGGAACSIIIVVILVLMVVQPGH